MDEKWFERVSELIKLIDGLPAGEAHIEWQDKTIVLIKVRINDKEVVIKK